MKEYFSKGQYNGKTWMVAVIAMVMVSLVFCVVTVFLYLDNTLNMEQSVLLFGSYAGTILAIFKVLKPKTPQKGGDKNDEKN